MNDDERPTRRGGRSGHRNDHHELREALRDARRGTRMRRGDVRNSLLIALLDGPSHGYDLIGHLEQRSGGRWRPSPGSVYPALQLLDDEDLVTSRREDGKQVFELTETGRAQAAEHLEQHGSPWDALDAAGGSEHGRLRVAMRDLHMAAKQVGVTGTPEVIARAVDIVTQARKDLYRLLADA